MFEKIMYVTAESYLAFLIAGGLFAIVFSYLFGSLLIRFGFSKVDRGLFYALLILLVSALYEYHYGVKDLFQLKPFNIYLFVLWMFITLIISSLNVFVSSVISKRDSLHHARSDASKDSSMGGIVRLTAKRIVLFMLLITLIGFFYTASVSHEGSASVKNLDPIVLDYAQVDKVHISVKGIAPQLDIKIYNGNEEIFLTELLLEYIEKESVDPNNPFRKYIDRHFVLKTNIGPLASSDQMRLEIPFCCTGVKVIGAKGYTNSDNQNTSI